MRFLCVFFGCKWFHLTGFLWQCWRCKACSLGHDPEAIDSDR
jgi:hypothetical protein